MRLLTLSAQNFRSLADFSLQFDELYSVISGKNNAGKSAIFKAVELLVGFDRNEVVSFSSDRDDVTWIEDVTFWKKDLKEDIVLSIKVEIDEVKDASVFEFVKRISKENIEKSIVIEIKKIITCDQSENLSVTIMNSTVMLDDVAIREINRLIKERGVFILHDSTHQVRLGRFYGDSGNEFFSPSGEDKKRIENLNRQFAQIMNRASKKKKEMIEEILGTLGEKYVVNLEYPTVKFDKLPFQIALGPVDKVDSQISGSMIQDCLLGGGFGSRRPDRYGMADHRGAVAHRAWKKITSRAR